MGQGEKKADYIDNLGDRELSGIICALLGGLANYCDVVELRRTVCVLAEDDGLWKGLTVQSDHLKRMLRGDTPKRGAN